MEIVRALSSHHFGLDRNQIVKATDVSNGGGLTRKLKELEFSGFIHGYHFFNQKKRYKRYRLIDEYSNFHLKFIEGNLEEGSGIWEGIRKRQRYISWRGYAFENLGLRHLPQIRKALGIAGVSTITSTFYHKGNEYTPGIQIDLIIERADRASNLCEFKFYKEPVNLSTKQADSLRKREDSFRELTKAKAILFTTMVAPFGITAATNVKGVIQQTIRLEDLFQGS